MAVQARTFFGDNDPITNLIGAPIGSRYIQFGTTIEWEKYGNQNYNWFPVKLDVRDGILWEPGDAINSVVETTSVAGTGTVTVNTGLPGRPGLWVAGVTSTVTPDRSRMFWSGGGGAPLGAFVPGGGRMLLRTSAFLAALSDAVNRISFRIGFFDNIVSADATNGMYFENDRAVNGSNNWFAVTADNGARTRTDCGVAPVAGVFNRLGIDCNPAGTSCRFMVDDVSVATVVANIPSAGRGSGVVGQLIKTLGALGAMSTTVDYMRYAMINDAGR